MKYIFKQSMILGFLGVLLWGGASSALASNKIFYFLTLKIASQNTANPPSGDQGKYLKTIASEHGKVEGNTEVTPIGFAFDFYRAIGSWGSGFGIEVNSYSNEYSFKDGSSVNISTRGLLYSLTTYYRGGSWFPFFALGTGNYYIKVDENLKATETSEAESLSFLDSTPNVFMYEIGARVPLDSWGILFSWRSIGAKVKIQTVGERLELGGSGLTVGAFYAY